MEIKTVDKGNGTIYNNIDFREIPYGNSESLVLLNNEPFEVQSQYGKSYIFKLFYGGKEVTAFVPESYKGEGFGKKIADDLKGFKRGDILSISKLEGKTKTGRPFRFFKTMKTGVENNIPEEKVYSPTTTENKPQTTQNLNLALPVKEEVIYSEKETSLIEAIKKIADLKKEDRVQLIVQNGIEYNRAVDIVNANF